MRIREVGYGFTFNVGNYQSERIDCRIEIEEGETARDALDEARQFVQVQHKRGVEAEQLEQRVMRLRSDEEHARNKVGVVLSHWREAVERYNELRALLQQHGVEIKPLGDYYLPPKQGIAEVEQEDEDTEDNDDGSDVWEDE
jgi:hypothetical protein